MYSIEVTSFKTTQLVYKPVKAKRISSIDLLRGIVMIIMALDHVRDYFHKEAFLYTPEDLSQTSPAIFLTRWITHFCAPVFVFLAGISAYLYGAKNGKKKLALFLATRGLWLMFAELFIVTLGWTFNPSYQLFNLQVIWATGVSMIFLSAIIYLPKWVLLMIAVVLIAGHNFLDTVHVTGRSVASVTWSLLHEPGYFRFEKFSLSIRYPALPWIGVITFGYIFGGLYKPDFDPQNRRQILLLSGIAITLCFGLLRVSNMYGDSMPWPVQKTRMFTILSFLNVSKYPPSLLYLLMTLGPALILLGVTEKPFNYWTTKLCLLGRVPMFYYLVHIFLIHALAMIAAVASGFPWSAMVLSTRVNAAVPLKGYGFDLMAVYAIWLSVVFLLFPLCAWFDRYKREHQVQYWWLNYL